MKRMLMLGLVLATGLFTTAARADVDIRIGIGVPGVVIGTDRRHHHYHPPARHYHYAPPVVYYYPEKAYRKPHKHYKGKHAHRHAPKQVHRGYRQGPPPHARAHGHWSR